LRPVGAAGSAVAFERGSGTARFIVAVNAGDSAVRLALRLPDAPGDSGGHLVPIEMPGFAEPAETRIVEGTATIDLEAQSGAVLRVV
jgi:hypothetical protein